MQDVVIVAANRTAIGSFQGSLATVPAAELGDDILYQLGALRELARVQGVALQHIKPHGALYMHLAGSGRCAGSGRLRPHY